MANTRFVCSAGTIVFAGSSIASMDLSNVVVDVSSDIASFNSMVTGGKVWTATSGGSKTWTVTFDTALDSTIGIDLALTVGIKAVLTFDTVDGLALGGTATITGASINAPVDDYATVSWSAQGTGAITEE